MKRLTLSVLLFTVCLVAGAAPVGRQQARRVAQQFLAERGRVLKADATPYRAPRKGAPQQDAASYYIYNVGDGGGYVIVSGDDRTEEILGYVDSGDFDAAQMPANMQAWLQRYDAEIQSLDDADATNEKAKVRRRVTQKVRHRVDMLLKTKWNQGSPYNQSLPNYYDGTTLKDAPAPLTGCVATAMAQVMNYHRWPAATVAKIPSYSTYYSTAGQSLTRDAIPAGTTIDWNNMKNTYSSGSETAAQKAAVANLMKYCGFAVKMEYEKSSGASTARHILHALTDYFGYDEGLCWKQREQYNRDEWEELMYDEMEAGRPVIIRGSDPDGGHAFVVDGYDGDGLFHVNWGWGGNGNGWFVVTSLNATYKANATVSGDANGYTQGVGAVFNLHKPDGSGKGPYVDIKSSFTLDGTTITASFENMSNMAASFFAGIGILDETTDKYVPIGTTVKLVSNLANGSSTSVSKNVAGCLPDGTYKLFPIFRHVDSDEWQTYFYESRRYVETTVSGGTTTLKDVTPKRKFDVTRVELPGNRMVNKEQLVLATIHNSGDGEFYGTMKLYGGLDGAKDDLESVMVTAVPANSTTTLQFYYKPTVAGDYTFYICNKDGSTEYAKVSATIGTTNATPAGALRVDGYTVSNATGTSPVMVFDAKLSGTLHLTNTGEGFYGALKVALRASGADSDAKSVTTPMVYVAAGGTADVPFSISGAEVGTSYNLQVSYTDRNSSGTLTNGAAVDSPLYQLTTGLAYWGLDGAMSTTDATATPTDAAAVYLSSDAAALTPNSRSNTLYYIESEVTTPSALVDVNVVEAGTAARIALTDEEAYYVPRDFVATNATFTHTFAASCGTGWETLTMPFDATTICVDGTPCNLTDYDKKFAIYELRKVVDGEPYFAPATELRANTPYLIAADASLAGKEIVFGGHDVQFYTTNAQRNKVTVGGYTWCATHVSTAVAEGYRLNAAGTQFEWATQFTAGAVQSYFTSTLAAGSRLTDIVLPSVPDFDDIDLVKMNDVYQISSAQGLKAFADLVNGSMLYRAANAVLVADIDMTGVNDFQPIGLTMQDGTNDTAYQGIFDGQGHKISHLSIETDATAYQVGLFSRVFAGVVRNVQLEDVNITTKSTTAAATGALIGRNGSGLVENCSAVDVNFKLTESVTSGTAAHAGLVGYMSASATSRIRNSFTSDEVLTVMGSGATTTNCYCGADVTAKGATGELCYLLNGSGSDSPVWYQKLGDDAYPVLNATHGVVYEVGSVMCDGTPLDDELMSYSNTNDRRVVHTFDGNLGICDLSRDELDPELDSRVLTDGKYEIGSDERMTAFGIINSLGRTNLPALLTSDINMSGKAWTSLTDYTGTFDGDNHTISGMTAPLCQSTSDGAAIKNLTLEGTLSSTQDRYGAFVADHTAGALTLENCTNSASITGTHDRIGGLVGNVSAGTLTMTDCKNVADLTSTCGNLAGLVGDISATTTRITNCYNTASVISTEESAQVAGLVATNRAAASSTMNLLHCANMGIISGMANGSGNSNIGGLVGWFSGASKKKLTISECYNTAPVTGTGNNIGGILGQAGANAYVSVTNSFNTGNVTGGAVSDVRTMCGKLATVANCSVTCCFNAGTLTGGTTKTLAISTAKITNSFNIASDGFNSAQGAGKNIDGYSTDWNTNGHFAYYMNTLAGEKVYYQTLSVDATPVLDATHGVVNKVTSGTEEYFYNGTVASMTLKDLADYVADADFTAESLTYDRELAAGGYHSLCLPFAIKTSDLPSGSKLFTLKEVGTNSVTLSEVDEVKAGVPCFASVTSKFSFGTMVNVEMKKDVANGERVKGTFTEKTGADAVGVYKLDPDGTYFAQTTSTGNKAVIKPFRSYIDLDEPASGVKTLNILLSDGTNAVHSPQSIVHSEVYDLAGRRVQKATKGLYIVNGKKVQK